jgi:hypothetical protein
VDEAGGVGDGEAAAGLQEHGEHLGPRAPGAAQPVFEGDADDELHRDVDEVAVGADLVDGDDVGVGEAGHGLGLAEEAGVGQVGLAGDGEAGAQELDGDFAAELGVEGGAHEAHAAGAELLEHGEAADASGQRSEPGPGALQAGVTGVGRRAALRMRRRALRGTALLVAVMGTCHGLSG